MSAEQFGYASDDSMERSTNRYMIAGAVLMILMVAVFPLYRLVEPAGRADAREAQLADLAAKGEQLWGTSCASCHGVAGEGGIGPALNSTQFLRSATDEQTETLVAVGIPGTQMSAYSLDHGGPLTTEQIESIVTYIRSWEPNAPDNPDWRAMLGG